jgi:hypothetical protein
MKTPRLAWLLDDYDTLDFKGLFVDYVGIDIRYDMNRGCIRTTLEPIDFRLKILALPSRSSFDSCFAIFNISGLNLGLSTPMSVTVCGLFLTRL